MRVARRHGRRCRGRPGLHGRLVRHVGQQGAVGRDRLEARRRYDVHPPPAHRLPADARCAARRRPDRRSRRPRPSTPARRSSPTPRCPRTSASAPSAATPVGPRPRRQAGPDRGLLPEVPHAVLLRRRSCSRATLVGGQYEVVGLPRPRRPGLDLPGPRPQRLRPLGRAQGPAQRRRPRRARRRGRRAAVPGRGRAPADRRDLQLRDARGRRLHRHGVRRRHARSSRSSRTGCGDQRRSYDPLPVDQAIAYIVEILPGVQLPARPRAALLRLQAGQRDPGRRRGQADRPRRRAPRRRRRLARSTARSATRRRRWPRSGRASPRDIYTIGRTLAVLCMEFRGYQSTYVATRCRRSTSTPAVRRARLALPAAREGSAPDPADRFESADELRDQLLGVLREIVAASTTGTALTSAASVLFEAPSVVRRRRSSWSDLPALRADATDPQHAWLASVGSRRPGAAARRPASRRRRTPPRCCSPGRSAALELGEPGKAARDAAPSCSPSDPWEWRARLDRRPRRRCSSGDWAATPRRRSTRSTGRCPASWRPSWRWPSPARTAASPTSPRGSTATCAATDAAYVAPAAFGLARVRAERQRHDGRRRGARPGAGHQPRLPGEPPAPRRRAAGRRRQVDLAVLDQALAQHRVGARWTRPSAARYTIRILGHALDVVTTVGPDAGGPGRPLPGRRGEHPRRARGGLPRRWPAMPAT